VGLRAEYPARFQLVAAMNPCPCGYAGTSRECRCRMQDITRYRARLSGPLLDRIDLRVTLQPVTENAAEGSVADSVTESRQAEICEQVAAARALQVGRQGAANASLVAKEIESMGISLKARAALQRIAAKRALSLRAQHRVLRVSRTLADMQSPLLTQPIELWHISEALQLRQALENE
jgi:magnesium chelatase family protein